MSSFNQSDVYAAAVVLPCLGTIVVALRFYVRTLKKTTFMADDWSILTGLGLIWACGIILIVGASNGSVGTHTMFDPVTGKQISTNTSNMTAKLYFAFMLCFTLAIGFIKFSVLLLYRRIFVSLAARRVSLGLSIFVGIWTLAFALARVLQCGTRVSAAWDPTRIRQYCLAQQKIDTSFAATDVFTDLVVILSPIPFIWQLKMSLAHKVSVTCIFMLGLFSTAAGATRLAFVVEFNYKTVTGHRDVQAIGTIQMMWAIIEGGVACVAVCMPTLRPLYQDRAPESLIHSVRSRLSLSSRGSSKRLDVDHDNEKPYDQSPKLAPSDRSSQSTIVVGLDAAFDEKEAEFKIPRGSIRVQNSVSQEMVPRDVEKV